MCVIRMATDRYLQVRVALGTMVSVVYLFFFFSSRRRHTRLQGDWSSDVCSSDLIEVRRISPAPSDSGLAAVEWAARLESLGAGEILLTSMDADGTQNGYDLALTRSEERRVGKEGRSRWSPYH